jgi:hypothetical protein
MIENKLEREEYNNLQVMTKVIMKETLHAKN